MRDLVTAAAIHARYWGADGTLRLFAHIQPQPGVDMALAEGARSFIEQIDGSLVLESVTPVVTEAPLAGLADSPERRTAAADQLLRDLTETLLFRWRFSLRRLILPTSGSGLAS